MLHQYSDQLICNAVMGPFGHQNLIEFDYECCGSEAALNRATGFILIHVKLIGSFCT